MDMPKMTTPDIDNVFKFYTDAMNGVFYNDDAQIVAGHVYKQWSDHDAVVIMMEEAQCVTP